MKQWVWVLLTILFIQGVFGLFLQAFADNEPSQSQASFLQPADTVKKEFRFHIDAVDPLPETNPKGAEAPGYRGQQQLVVYTPGFGDSTQTNDFGTEAIVENGVIRTMALSNSLIPANGFVISGHGQAGQWMKRVLKRGAMVTLDRSSPQIMVRLTPQVYLIALQDALEQAEKRPVSNDERYNDYLQKANSCYAELKAMASGDITQTLVDLSLTCQKLANKAAYRTVLPLPGEFRGIWVRPLERNPEQVEKTVAELEATGFKHIFLETYALGNTIYPSAVMVDYGLPPQKLQFVGWDPLKAWVESANRHHMKIYAWVQTFYAGNQQSSLEPYGPILHKYPLWTNVQRNHVAVSQPYPSVIEDGHYFLDPANPEVRQFLEKLFTEMAIRYPVDGLNIDYIRYPASQPSKNPSYQASTWGYTPVARKAFMDLIEKERKELEAKRIEEAKKAGKPLPKVKHNPLEAKEQLPKTDPAELPTSDPLWPRWVGWRKDQVSSFVQELTATLRAQNPKLFISAVVFPQSDPQNLVKLQDWPQWAKKGWVDALTPIGLGPSVSGVYKDSLNFRRITEGHVPVYPGIFGMYNRLSPVEMLDQVDAVHRAGLPGVVFFERAHLTPEYTEALLDGPFRSPANY